ncbi:hypothetical protein DRQ05_06245 [bacterium]|nr:MAG: hypothetical protein DRQ05_06245 [bacterium]
MKENSIQGRDSILKTEEEISTTSEPCPFCGARASIRIRSFYMFADEDEVNIMKCTKCGKNFRVGSGVSGY